MISGAEAPEERRGEEAFQGAERHHRTVIISHTAADIKHAVLQSSNHFLRVTRRWALIPTSYLRLTGGGRRREEVKTRWGNCCGRSVMAAATDHSAASGGEEGS